MQTDLLILGGGCAGLSLAMQLAKLGERSPRALIVESRTAYTNDRTWCFWCEPTARYTSLVRHRWPGVAVTTPRGRVQIPCPDTPYAMLRSEVFYAQARETIDLAPRIDLALGATIIGEPVKIDQTWHVQTTAGACTARWIVDTRPPQAPQTGNALLWQSFYGHEIECSDAVFNTGVAELMHFDPVDAAQEDGILFSYVLPFSPKRALLEATVFGKKPLGPEAFQRKIEHLTERRCQGADYRIRHTEHGILPMGLSPTPQPVDPTWVRVGIMAGAARPSTGYAFQRIQRWAETCAEALSHWRAPVPQAPDSKLMNSLDRLFLKVLRNHPSLGPDLFFTLFNRVDIARMVRFMSDQATLTDYAAIVAALPSRPFLRQLREQHFPSGEAVGMQRVES
jgi:lycopene beta-cyclase